MPNPLNLKPRVREVWQHLPWMAGRQLVSTEPPKLWSAVHTEGGRTRYRETKKQQPEINPTRKGCGPPTASRETVQGAWKQVDGCKPPLPG